MGDTKNKDRKKKVKMTLQEYKQREMGPLWDIINFSSNIYASLYADSTGVKLPESCYRGALLSQNRLNSEEYLLNSKRCSIDMAIPLGVFSYASFGVRGSLSFRHFIEEEEQEKEGNVVILPPYKNINVPLGSVIRSRRSVREMKGRKIGLTDLSTLLFFANGVTGDFDHSSGGNEFVPTESLGSRYVGKIRTAPSGGGLYPVYLYLIAQNVEGLEEGVYLFQPLTHSLKVVKIFDDRDLEEFHTICEWGYNIDNSKIGASIFYVYNLYENSRKYVDMGLTFALIEAGEISQNIHLASTALNLASCDIGGYDKVLCEGVLEVDGLTKHIVHLTIVGN